MATTKFAVRKFRCFPAPEDPVSNSQTVAEHESGPGNGCLYEPQIRGDAREKNHAHWSSPQINGRREPAPQAGEPKLTRRGWKFLWSTVFQFPVFSS